jgi:hypothetical protein
MRCRRPTRLAIPDRRNGLRLFHLRANEAAAVNRPERDEAELDESALRQDRDR